MPAAVAVILDPAPTVRSGLVRAEGRDPEQVKFEASLVAFFVEAADLLGVPKSVAAIYGICFASPEPLGFSEIQERLDISAGSISQGVRVLREVGALKVSEGIDSSTLNAQSSTRDAKRRDRFEPDLELRKLIEHWLAERLSKQLSAGQGRLKAMESAVPGGRSASAKLLRKRLSSLKTWHGKAQLLLPMVRTFLKLT